MVDFNRWREAYDAMSYADHVAFYDTVWERYPSQQHFDADSASRFFDLYSPRRVVEVGGWQGELADRMLASNPCIQDWTNYEICRGAVDHSVPKDVRYAAVALDDWVWNRPWLFEGVDTLVASHVIEHMRARDLEALVGCLDDVQHAFIASPLSGYPASWEGYNGSHILEIGWDGVDEIMSRRGFALLKEPMTYEVRCYERR